MTQSQAPETTDRRHDVHPVELEAFLRVQNLNLKLLRSYLELEHPVSEEDAEELAERNFSQLVAEDPERLQEDSAEEAWKRAYESRAAVWQVARLDVLRIIGQQVRRLLTLGDPTLRTWKYLVEGGPDVSDL